MASGQPPEGHSCLMLANHTEPGHGTQVVAGVQGGSPAGLLQSLLWASPVPGVLPGFQALATEATQ